MYMDIETAKELKKNLQRDISELLKSYETNVGLNVSEIDMVRQPIFDNFGNEVDYSYAVEVKSFI